MLAKSLRYSISCLNLKSLRLSQLISVSRTEFLQLDHPADGLLPSTSRRFYAGKRRTVRKPIVYEKKKLDRLEVWRGMTIRDLAKKLNNNDDLVFECLLHTDFADLYDKPNQKLDDPTLISQIVKMNGYVAEFVSSPAQKLKNLVKEALNDVELYPRKAADPKDLKPRPAVVTIMGHVDHGKTTLLDSLRRTQVVATEHGGITQHIGAFSVKLPLTKQTITFLDTPGHAAFHKMRMRGARVTDIAVLVVAADDGVKDQTKESIKFAREANVPILVAINKIDKNNANLVRPALEKCTKDLMAVGLIPEEYGGDTQVVKISALQKIGLKELQEAIVTLAELSDLKSDPDGLCEGFIVESKTVQGRGKVATVLVKRGTLKKQTIVVAGTAWARVRTLCDENLKTVKEAPPSRAVEMSGWKEDLPSAGDYFIAVPSEARALEVVKYRKDKEWDEKLEKDAPRMDQLRKKLHDEYIEDRESRRAAGYRSFRRRKDYEAPKQEEFSTRDKTLPRVGIILRGDVDGSVDAIMTVLQTFNSKMCNLEVIDFAVGAPTASDIEIAREFDGRIVTFNIKTPPDVMDLAEKRDVAVDEFNIIYRLVESIRAKLENLLPPGYRQNHLGEGKVIREFLLTIKGKRQAIAGTLWEDGIIDKKKSCRVKREEKVIYDGPIRQLKIKTLDVGAGKSGDEIGISVEDVDIRFQIGDAVECYETEEVRQELDWKPEGFC